MREGCRIVYGHMPLGEFLRLLKETSDDCLLHAEVARMLGATAAIGPRQGLARIREQDAPAAMGRVRAQLGRAARRLEPDAIRWLAAGEQGLSSLALFTLLSGIRPLHYRGSGLDLPADAGEFRRCRLLVEQTPSLGRKLPALAQRVTEPAIAAWAALAEAWRDLCIQMDHELPGWRERASRAPGVEAMLACFLDVATESAALQSGRITSASLALPYSRTTESARRGSTARWSM